MALRLVVGRANIGKTGVALEAVRSAHAEGRQPILVLPSQPDVQRAADELADSDALGFRVMTFDAYLDHAWGRCGDGRSIVRGPARRLLASAAARKAGAGPGMGELAASCVTALAGQLGESWRTKTPSDTGAGARLVAVILNYRDALERLGLVEREEAAFRIAGDPLLPGDPLVVHRFIDFTAWQERILLGASSTRETLVTLTWEEGFAPTTALQGLVDRLGSAPETAQGSTFSTDTELVRLADALFAEPMQGTPNGAVRFSRAEGYEAEAYRIAEEIREVVEEYGSTGDDCSIVVAFRRPERHLRFIREAFDEAGIEAEYDVRVPLGTTAFGGAVLSMLRFLVTGDRDLLLSVLKSPFGGGEREAVLEIEREWRKGGVTGRAALTDGLWKPSKSLQRVVRRAEKISGGGIDTDAARVLAGAVGELLVLGHGREGTTGSVAVEDAASHAAVQRVLGEIARVDDSSILLADVIDALQRSIVTMNTAERPGVVQVTAVDRMRGRRYDTVIIGGLNSDEFPEAPSESMQPGSSVADVLAAFGGSGESPKGVEYEQLLFYTALTRAQKRLVLSARTADSDGDPAGISPLYEAVADSYRPADEEGDPPSRFRALSQTPESSESATDRERLRAAARPNGDSDERSAAARWRSKARIAVLRQQASLERLASAEAFSPSALDTYLSCPYSWFYSRAIGAETLESEFDSREQGSFAHEVLANAYMSLLETGITRVTQDTIEAARAAVTAAWDELDSRAGEPASVLERSERRATLTWALRIIDDDVTFAPGFNPSRMEWKFGLEGAEPVDLGGFKLHGVIDRVDVDAAGRAIVADYKRSSGPTAANILAKRQIQVPLYMEAVRVGLGLEPVAGVYRGLRKRCDRGLILGDAGIEGPFTSTDVKDASEFRFIVESALDLARTAAAGIREGRIEQAPFDPGSCKTCRALAVCGGAR